VKIGILTFHWATNYGAVLQCFALQSYLESKGYNVKIINYKPRRYDDTLYNFLRDRKFLNYREYLKDRKKEAALADFRSSHLHQTERILSYKKISSIVLDFDILISGSDQVVNPSFLMSGEGYGKISPVYFLGFPFKGKRIGYALSFGCVIYPEKACKIATKFIKDFDVISVREESGIDIMRTLGRNDAFVVPDPTLLMESQFYHSLADEGFYEQNTSYIYGFFIRHILERKYAITNVLDGKHILWNNDDEDYTMQGWLNKIRHSEFVVTDSFHCVVMCLKLHKPFAVITELEGNVGMNDRLYTLLGSLSLLNHIVHKGQLTTILKLEIEEIDWKSIDYKIFQTKEIVEYIF